MTAKLERRSLEALNEMIPFFDCSLVRTSTSMTFPPTEIFVVVERGTFAIVVLPLGIITPFLLTFCGRGNRIGRLVAFPFEEIVVVFMRGTLKVLVLNVGIFKLAPVALFAVLLAGWRGKLVMIQHTSNTQRQEDLFAEEEKCDLSTSLR